jgi:transcriptional regulator with XRE-family HTH domain
VLYITFRKHERKATGRQLAKAAGCSRAWISKIENGHANPSTDELKRIAKFLRCKPEQLLVKVQAVSL